MKICLYTGHYKALASSGMGKALEHQLAALSELDVEVETRFTTDADLIHLNDWFPATVRLAKKARRNGLKVVYHAHSTEEDFRNSFRGSNLLSPLFKHWLRYCYRQGDLVITPTPYSKKILEDYRLNRPIVAISNGIDLTKFNRANADGQRFREQYNLRPEQKAVISVGHFMQRKGIVDFVELAKRHPDIEFIWFGHSPRSALTSEVAEAVRTKLPNLRFPGYIKAAELRDAYAGANCFLFMTHEETEGIVLLEAMAMNIPVLIRDIPIYEEFYDGECLYKARTAEEFDFKLRAILDQSLPSTIEAAYEEVRKRSLPEVGKQLLSAYKSVVNS